MSGVDAWRATVEPATRATIDALRAIAREAGPQLTESIKWNAPSFAYDGEDRITLGIDPKGQVRAVLHRGATPRTDGFEFDDPDRLAQWPAPDRGVITFDDAASVTRKRTELTDLFMRWLEATE